MPKPRWLTVSLARKISLLFGTAVLLTIIATLAFPWRQMTLLDEQAILQRARQVAQAAYLAVDITQPNWDAVQEALNERWPYLTRELDLPDAVPVFVVADPTRVGGFAPDPWLQRSGFRIEAIRQLQSHPDHPYYWRIQDEGRLFRLAHAVRAGPTDPHPHVLKGIIDVRLPIDRQTGMWNSAITFLAGASGAVLAILVFYMVTQRIVLSRVHALRKVAEQVTTGDIDVRADIRSGDEFQDLASTLNAMLTHLKAAQEELRTINRSLDVRLGELAETNVDLYEANRLKSQFLSNVSHELRTPLVSIIGFAELLEEAWKSPSADASRMARFSRNILTSGRSLLDIINDLLDLAKIEAGKMELHVSAFDPGELCGDLIDFVQPLADKRRQTLTLELGEALPQCQSDSGKIQQILYNLLSNAIKFTPEQGAISLTVSTADGGADGPSDRLRLAVRDSGPGIALDDQESIFEKFRQLDSSRTRQFEGTGLGLAITKELVHTLGGSIKVESQPDAGATFTVELPAILDAAGSATGDG
jgi:signal transduction histidine kinase